MTHDPTEARAALSRLLELQRAVVECIRREAILADQMREAKQATRRAIGARDSAMLGELAELPLFDGPDLPKFREGEQIDITGGLDSAAFVRRDRGGPEADPAPKHESHGHAPRRTLRTFDVYRREGFAAPVSLGQMKHQFAPGAGIIADAFPGEDPAKLQAVLTTAKAEPGATLRHLVGKARAAAPAAAGEVAP